MKSNFIFFILLLILYPELSRAQDGKFKLGLRFAPGFSMTRVQDADEKDNATYTAGPAGLRFSAGLTGDFYFGRNYSFYTGLWYSVAKAALNADIGASGNNARTEIISNIQYIQVPLALKLFTNEIATDAKLYFVVGGTVAGKLKEIPVSYREESNNFVKAEPGKGYFIGDAGLLLGIGTEYRLGENTNIFGGFSYNRGLMNVCSQKGPLVWQDRDASGLYKLYLGQFSLEMGIKF